MAERDEARATVLAAGDGTGDKATRGIEEGELEAEQESAEAMDAEVTHADVPEPPGASRTTEGQPS